MAHVSTSDTGRVRRQNIFAVTRYESASRASRSFLAILLLALILRIAAAIPLTLTHPDEIGQYLEQAHRLVFGPGLIPWEYRYGIRSWLLPLAISMPMRLGEWLAPGTMTYLTAVRIFMALIALGPVVSAWAIGRRASAGHAVVAMFVMAIWWEFIYFGVHPITEPVAVAAILGATALLARKSPSRNALFASGLLLGIGGLLRIQYGPAITIIAIASLRQDLQLRLPSLACGIIAALLVGAAVDLWAGHTPFAWIVGNVTENVLKNRAALFGIMPRLTYFMFYLYYWQLACVPICALAIAGAHRRRALGATALVTITVHMLIGHKEYRFVLLATTIIVLLSALGSVDVILVMARRGPWRMRPRRAIAILIAGWGMIASALAIADPDRGRWTWFGESMVAAYAAGRNPGTCGVIVERRLTWLSAYSLLHANVPLSTFPDMAREKSPTLDQISRGANVVIGAAANRALVPPGYRAEICYQFSGENLLLMPHATVGRVCVFRRPGGCDPQALRDWNTNISLARIDN